MNIAVTIKYLQKTNSKKENAKGADPKNLY